MKKRLLSGFLAVVIIATLFPVTVYAVNVADGETLKNNYSDGVVTENHGTVINNHGTVTNNNNGGKVMNNNNGGLVEKNEGTVEYNRDTVTNNNNGGTVIHNYGTVTNNNGTVKSNKFSGVVTENHRAVESNYGTVTNNNNGGTVMNNSNGGLVGKNEGTVKNNYGTVTNNNNGGFIDFNEGTVTNNNNGGMVTNNFGTVTNNNNGGFMTENEGIVSNNNNGGTVDHNDNIVENNYGTVKSNRLGSVVTENHNTVRNNSDTVENNYGMVTNNFGTVTDNFGTVGFNTNVPDIAGTITNNYVILKDYPEGKITNQYYKLTVKDDDKALTITSQTYNPIKQPLNTYVKKGDNIEFTLKNAHYQATISIWNGVATTENIYGYNNGNTNTISNVNGEVTIEISKLSEHNGGTATCTDKATCDVCGEPYDEVDEENHDWGEWQTTTPATCTEKGMERQTCFRCGKYIEREINALGHDWDEWQTTPATCTEDGLKTRTCKTNSEHKETQTISALGHDYTEKIIPPTPEKLGGTLYTCTRCGDQYYDNYTMVPGTHPSKMPDGSPITKSAVPKAKNEIEVNGETITMILQDPLGVLVKNKSDDLRLDSVYVEEGSDRHNELMANLDPTYSVENIQFYEIVPYVNGEKKSGELANMVRLLYKIPDGWDREDMEAVLVGEDKDLEFDERLEVIDGEYYLVLWTNHFSPYSFIDTLSEEEKEALNQDNNPNSENNTDGINYIVTEETDTEIADTEENQESENSEQIEDNSVSNQINTGYDNTHKMLILFSILITSGLFLEIFIKKKLKV